MGSLGGHAAHDDDGVGGVAEEGCEFVGQHDDD